VPEGLTIEQTAVLFKTALGTDSVAFINACRDPALLRNHLIPTATVEGYLFPDTYRFLPGVLPLEIVRRMVAHFDEKFAEMKDSLQNRSMTEHDIVVLASIVEKEAVVNNERPLIAGVFQNRLNKNCPLGADPTIRYYLRKFDGPLHVSELSLSTPFNTRKYAGLPPNPICSPGIASLQAAMHPLTTKYFYFVAKWDGSGAHDFSVTNEEHCKKKNEIRRKNDIRKTVLKKEKA
jgi:UPF0755 protein